METNELIHDLSQDVKPIRRLSPLRRRLSVWLLIGVLCVAAGTALMGLPKSWAEASQQATYWVEVVCILMVALLAATSAFVLSVPGRERPMFTRALPMVALLTWLGFLGIRMVSTISSGGWQAFVWDVGAMCVWNLLILGVLPGVLLFVLIHQAAPLRRSWTGLSASLAVASVAALGAKFLCMSASPLHLLLWHFAPVFGVGLLGVGLGRWLLPRV